MIYEVAVALMFKLESASYAAGTAIPAKFAMTAVKGGENRSPEFHWPAVPKGTASLVLSIVDRHPMARGWVHWVVCDMPPETRSLPEGASGTLKMPRGSFELINSFGKPGWGGPQPPPGTGPHQYEATLYALSAPKLAGLSAKSSWDSVQQAMAGKILGKAMHSGTFER